MTPWLVWFARPAGPRQSGPAGGPVASSAAPSPSRPWDPAPQCSPDRVRFLASETTDQKTCVHPRVIDTFLLRLLSPCRLGVAAFSRTEQAEPAFTAHAWCRAVRGDTLARYLAPLVRRAVAVHRRARARRSVRAAHRGIRAAVRGAEGLHHAARGQDCFGLESGTGGRRGGELQHRGQ